MPAPISPKGAGMACLALAGGGLSCLDENGWQTYSSKTSDLPSGVIYAMTSCPDGRIALAYEDVKNPGVGVSLFDGKKWEHIDKVDKISGVEGLACSPKSEIWLTHFQGVSRYSGGQWTTYGSEQLATGASANELVYDVAVAADGDVWVVTSRSVARFEDAQWTVFQKGQGIDANLFFKALTLDSAGRPWAGHSNGVAVYENGVWKLIKKASISSSSNSLKTMVLDARGQLWLSYSLGAAMFDGNTWVDYDRVSEHLRSIHIDALAADSLGRVWLGTTYGLVVFDGENWQIYRMDNSDLRDNHIDFIVVVNDGPTLPAPADKEKAIVTGKLNGLADQPLAGVRVEICVEAPRGLKFSDPNETPCSSYQPFFLSTETDAQGIFTFVDVPPGYYVLVAETGLNSWAQLERPYRTLVEPGQKLDLGTLTLDIKTD